MAYQENILQQQQRNELYNRALLNRSDFFSYNLPSNNLNVPISSR